MREGLGRAQSCQTLCNPMDCSPPGSSVLSCSSSRQTGSWGKGQMQRLPPPQWTCAHPADFAKGNTQRPVFSSLPVFPRGKHYYRPPESGQAKSKVLPKEVHGVGEVMGAYSPTAGLPLSTAVSRFAENLAQFLGAGIRSRTEGKWCTAMGLALAWCGIVVR